MQPESLGRRARKEIPAHKVSTAQPAHKVRRAFKVKMEIQVRLERKGKPEIPAHKA